MKAAWASFFKAAAARVTASGAVTVADWRWARRRRSQGASALASCLVGRAVVWSLVTVASATPGYGTTGWDGRPAPGAQAADKHAVVSPNSLATTIERALEGGQTERAREILGQILDRPGVDSDLLLKLGVEFAQRELYAEAARAFSRCVRENPGLFDAHYNLALAELARQRLPEALAALEAAPRASQADEPARLYLLGKIENAMGKTTEAEHHLSNAFQRAPQQENYALDLGLFYLRRQAYGRALETFERGSHFNPRSSFLMLGLAFAQFLGGRDAQSIAGCRKLIAQEPGFSPARLLLAFVLYMNGKMEDAEQVAAQGLTEPEPSAYLYYLHAAILVKSHSRDYDRILRELALANRLIPACALCYLTQSKTHEALGDVRAAIADLESAVRVTPAFSEAWYRLAPLYRRAGREADAMHAQEQFEALKATKETSEADVLRAVFLQAIGGEETSK